MNQNKEKTNESNQLKMRIEQDVQSRRPIRAQQRIAEWLAKSSDRDAAVLEACEWYRRLGMYRNGLKLLNIDQGFTGNISLETARGKRILWAARFLNAMGASEFALDIVKKLNPFDSSDWRIIGAIYLSNYHFKESIHAYESMLKIETNLNSYSSRLAKISLADALSETAEVEEALKLVSVVREASTEPILRGICFQATGEYLIKLQHFEDAIVLLQSAEDLIPKNDQSLDRGYLLKWMGYCYGKLGARMKAKVYFDSAEKLLFKADTRPEVGFELMRLKQELGYLSRDEAQDLYFFPGLAKGLKHKLPALRHADFGKKNANLKIDFTRNEFKIGKNFFLNIPRELELLGYIVVANKRGLSRTKVKALLWPNEFFSYLSMNSRLNQLVDRIRKQYKIKIDCKDETLFLSSASQSAVSVQVGTTQINSLFEVRDEFSGMEFAKFYNLKKTQASLELKIWLKSGKVTSVKSGRHILYRRTGP